MKFSMTEQGKGDLLIQVTAWPGLTVYYRFFYYIVVGGAIIRGEGLGSH
jgi:hypothetical protein